MSISSKSVRTQAVDVIVKQYWSIIDGGKQEYEVPMIKVTKLLVDKHIATDVEMAKKIVRGVQVNKTSSLVTYDEFKRIFCKAIFKNCLLSIINEILSYNPFGDQAAETNTKDENSMSVHIRSTSYQRQLLKKGILSETDEDLKRGRSKSFNYIYRCSKFPRGLQKQPQNLQRTRAV